MRKRVRSAEHRLRVDHPIFPEFLWTQVTTVEVWDTQLSRQVPSSTKTLLEGDVSVHDYVYDFSHTQDCIISAIMQNRFKNFFSKNDLLRA